MSWDEAIEHEITLPPTRLPRTVDETISVFGGEDMELVDGKVRGRILRQRWPLSARIHLTANQDGAYWRLSVGVENTAAGPPPDKDTAMRTSFIGAHLLLEAGDGEFVSLLEPPPEATDAAGRCQQDPRALRQSAELGGIKVTAERDGNSHGDLQTGDRHRESYLCPPGNPPESQAKLPNWYYASPMGRATTSRPALRA